MKKPQARERILGLRQQQLMARELEMAQAAEAVSRAEQHVAQQRQAWQDVSDELLQSGHQGLTLLTHTMLGLRQRLQQANAQLQEKQSLHRQAKSALLDARTKAEALGTLVEHTKQQWQQEIEKRAEMETSSFVMRQWKTRAQHTND